MRANCNIDGGGMRHLLAAKQRQEGLSLKAAVEKLRI
jgi:hypothetical protein